MLALGHWTHRRLLVVTRVPWISYNWGPYGVGANVLLAPGASSQGWAYTEDSLRACAESATRLGRKIAGVIITSPDNPTGKELSAERQVALGKAALRVGAAFVLYDWMYHTVTDHAPMDLNAFIASFEAGERPRLMFLDGLTKSLGASNIRSAHLIASSEVIKFLTARASHAVIPPFYGTAVAIAAYRAGFLDVARAINEPTSASRARLRQFITERGLTAILDQGYYAFIDVGEWLRRRGWKDSEPLGEYLAENTAWRSYPGPTFRPLAVIGSASPTPHRPNGRSALPPV
jgi:aspartate/methionine/tyrosine aminotransferase